MARIVICCLLLPAWPLGATQGQQASTRNHDVALPRAASAAHEATSTRRDALSSQQGIQRSSSQQDAAPSYQEGASIAKVSESEPRTFDVGDTPFSLTAADLNGDNRPELIVVNRFVNTVSILLNNGNGDFTTAYNYGAGVAPVAVIASDLNGDRKPDLVVANAGSDSISVLIGATGASFASRTDYPTAHVPCALAAGDLNGDNKTDLVVVNRYSNCVSVFTGNGDGTFHPRTDYPTGVLPYAATIMDLDGDGKRDLLIASGFDHRVSFLAGKGDCTFAPAIAYARWKTSWAAISQGNGPGEPELIEASPTSNTVSIMPIPFASRSRRLGTRTDYKTGEGPRFAAKTDLNGDRIADLVVVNTGVFPTYQGSVSVLAGTEPGPFEPPRNYSTGNMSHAVVVTDINGDGRQDIAVANGTLEFGGSVSVLMGHAKGRFGPRRVYATGAYIVQVSFSDDADSTQADVPIWTQR